MAQRYPVPVSEIRVEDVVQRSRFITTLAPAADIDAAKAFIARISAEFSDATHNCNAYLVGPPGSTAQVGMSDDGEPHGTAGRPMLNVLVHCGAGDLAVVVTRYFGGVKLGKGGLVRAYSGGVQHALDEVELADKITWVQARLVIDYAQLQGLKAVYPDFEVELVSEDFQDKVVHQLRIPEEKSQGFSDRIFDLSLGKARVESAD